MNIFKRKSMLKPSFEMSNFVAVPTSTTVGETHYSEVFETTCGEVGSWSLTVIRNLQTLLEITLYLLPHHLLSSKNAFNSFLCNCSLFNLAKRKVRVGSPHSKVMQQFLSAHVEPCPWIHFVWSAAIFQPNCTSGAAKSGWEWAKPTKDHVSIKQNAWFPSYKQGCARKLSLCENFVLSTQVTVTFTKITSCILIWVDVNNCVEIAWFVLQPEKG